MKKGKATPKPKGKAMLKPKILRTQPSYVICYSLFQHHSPYTDYHYYFTLVAQSCCLNHALFDLCPLPLPAQSCLFTLSYSLLHPCCHQLLVELPQLCSLLNASTLYSNSMISDISHFLGIIF